MSEETIMSAPQYFYLITVMLFGNVCFYFRAMIMKMIGAVNCNHATESSKPDISNTLCE
ncbi:hypothetical protein NIES4071_86280 [Calothrix sp. NIES-4071]|nr:hypothetical protein NIES4071_86280 [Calothrix sp. NIES-4071]BAZ62895.1 hypothetical protein NIES4105_86210 [Calothrix sp. NIES-4105]